MMLLIISALRNGTIIKKKGYYALHKEDLITLFVPSAVQNDIWMMHFIILALQNGAILNFKKLLCTAEGGFYDLIRPFCSAE
jgi:hypothetical protein